MKTPLNSKICFYYYPTSYMHLRQAFKLHNTLIFILIIVAIRFIIYQQTI